MADLQIYSWSATGNGGGANASLSEFELVTLGPDGVVNTDALEGTALEGADIFTSVIDHKLNPEAFFEVVVFDLNGTLYYAALDGGTLPTDGGRFRRDELETMNRHDNVVDVNDTTGVVACFVRGTRIDTPDGPKRIEDLAVGDLVDTLDNGPQAIRWIGRSTVKTGVDLVPIRFQPGALGEDLPKEPLLVSPAHRMIITGWRAEVLFGQEEVLVAAKSLINDTTIRPASEIQRVEYFHILFDTHQIIRSHGAWSESFHPVDSVLSQNDQAQLEELYEIFPQLRHDRTAYGLPARMVVSAKEARLIAD